MLHSLKIDNFRFSPAFHFISWSHISIKRRTRKNIFISSFIIAFNKPRMRAWTITLFITRQNFLNLILGQCLDIGTQQVERNAPFPNQMNGHGRCSHQEDGSCKKPFLLHSCEFWLVKQMDHILLFMAFSFRIDRSASDPRCKSPIGYRYTPDRTTCRFPDRYRLSARPVKDAKPR